MAGLWWFVTGYAYADFPLARAHREPKVVEDAGPVARRAARHHCDQHEWSEPMVSLNGAGKWDKKCLKCGYDLKDVALSDAEKAKYQDIGGN